MRRSRPAASADDPNTKLADKFGERLSHRCRFEWIHCLTNACIAGAAADPKMVKEMDSGQTLRLEFVDSNLLTLATSLPLGQFAAVHKAAPAQVFEQDIDE